MDEKIIYRDAKNGRFVKKEFAAENPDTTVREKRKLVKCKKTSEDGNEHQ